MQSPSSVDRWYSQERPRKLSVYGGEVFLIEHHPKIDIEPSLWLAHAFRGSYRQQNASAQQVAAGAAITLPLQELKPVDLMKTCSKFKVVFFRYLGNRLHTPGAITISPLPDLVRQAMMAT